MTEIGYALSSEEHSPNDLVRYARRAEEVGFILLPTKYGPTRVCRGHWRRSCRCQPTSSRLSAW